MNTKSFFVGNVSTPLRCDGIFNECTVTAESEGEKKLKIG